MPGPHGAKADHYQRFFQNRDWLLAKVNYKRQRNTPTGWRRSLGFRLNLTQKQVHNLLHSAEVELCWTNYLEERAEARYQQQLRAGDKGRQRFIRNCERRRRKKAKSIGSVVPKKKPGRPKLPDQFTIEVPYHY